MNRKVRYILVLLFLPVFLSIDLIKSKRSVLKKIAYFFLIWIFIGSTWISGYANIVNAIKFTLYELGITDSLSEVKVVGTSMLPTIEDGETITLNSPKKYGINRGDIVSFKNIETSGQFYIKRVVGLGGEEISIVNGFVLINGQELQEDYVYRNEPTYGNTFLVDCEQQAVPKDKIAVLGDNRIVSTDSRVLGFIDIKDIEGVIKKDVKTVFGVRKDEPKAKEISIDPVVFKDLINKERETDGSRPLEQQQLLDLLATERSKTVSANFEDWKKQTIPVADLLDRSGYQYLLVQEMITFGYLNEQQVVDQIMESIIYRDAFLSDDYYEVGIGSTEMQKDQCTFPVVSVILTWPSSPTYSQDVKDIWKQDIEDLSETISALQVLKSNSGINQNQTQGLIESLTGLLEIASQLTSRIDQGEWFTDQEYQLMEDYIEESKVVRGEVESYYFRYKEKISDQHTLELLNQLLPGNTEFSQKSQETKLLFGQGKYEEQSEFADELLRLAANDRERAMGHYWKGLAEYKLGKTTEAELNLKQATVLDESYAAPYVTLAAISFDNQNYNSARDYALLCVELDPDYAWCHNNLGLAHIYLGDKEKGIAELEEAVSLDPTSYVFNDNLNRANSN